jgi:hypothetical protein
LRRPEAQRSASRPGSRTAANAIRRDAAEGQQEISSKHGWPLNGPGNYVRRRRRPGQLQPRLTKVRPDSLLHWRSKSLICSLIA